MLTALSLSAIGDSFSATPLAKGTSFSTGLMTEGSVVLTESITGTARTGTVTDVVTKTLSGDSTTSTTASTKAIDTTSASGSKATDTAVKTATEEAKKSEPGSAAATTKKAMPKWVAPTAIAVLLIVAAIAAYKLWFTAVATPAA